MSLDNIREEIDSIDLQIQKLLMQRLDCSKRVVETKIEDGNHVIYRADREEAILEKLGAGISEDRKSGYLAVVRKITETSRMYQYGILYDCLDNPFSKLVGEIQIPETCRSVTLSLTRPNIPNAMSSILSMIGDYGYNMYAMELLSYSEDLKKVDFQLTVLGDIHEEKMKKLMFQLSMESANFNITAIL